MGLVVVFEKNEEFGPEVVDTSLEFQLLRVYNFLL